MITKSDLDQFYGSENYYRHSINRNLLYTEGIKFLADNAKCYWLLDTIALSQNSSKLKYESFQVWNIIVDNESGLIITEDGNKKVLRKEKLTYTDFPFNRLTIYVSNGVVLLPSEY